MWFLMKVGVVKKKNPPSQNSGSVPVHVLCVREVCGKNKCVHTHKVGCVGCGVRAVGCPPEEPGGVV